MAVPTDRTCLRHFSRRFRPAPDEFMTGVAHPTLRIAVLLVPVLLGLGPAPAGQDVDTNVGFQKHAAPVFQKYCIGCHGDVKPKGDLSLTKFKTAGDFDKHLDVLEALA